MNDPSDRETLLNDILAEPAPGEPQDLLLGHTLRAARRRRVMRRLRAAGPVFFIVVAAAALFLVVWRSDLPSPRQGQNLEKPYLLVHTENLPQVSYVATVPLSPLCQVSSSRPGNIAAVETRLDSPQYSDIDDATLIALAAPQPAVLVRLGPDSAQLILVPETASEN